MLWRIHIRIFSMSTAAKGTPRILCKVFKKCNLAPDLHVKILKNKELQLRY